VVQIEVSLTTPELYGNAPDGTHQQLNSTFYTRLYHEDEPLGAINDGLQPLFDEIRDAAPYGVLQATHGRNPPDAAQGWAGNQAGRM
jgi:hypothetical protein